MKVVRPLSLADSLELNAILAGYPQKLIKFPRVSGRDSASFRFSYPFCVGFWPGQRAGPEVLDFWSPGWDFVAFFAVLLALFFHLALSLDVETAPHIAFSGRWRVRLFDPSWATRFFS